MIDIPEEHKEAVEQLRLVGKLAGRVWIIDYATMTLRGGRCWYAERRWRVWKYDSPEAAYRGYPRRHVSFTTFENMRRNLLTSIGMEVK